MKNDKIIFIFVKIFIFEDNYSYTRTNITNKQK